MDSDTNVKAPKICAGHIYIIQTEFNLYIKIGFSVTCSAKLINRYITPYGSDMTLYWFTSTNVALHEARIHWRMKEARLRNELFRLDSLDEAIMVTKSVTGSEPDVIKYVSAIRKLTDPDSPKSLFNKKSKSIIKEEYCIDIIPDDYDDILCAPDVTRNEINLLIANYDPINKYTIDRFVIRDVYKWAVDINMEFLEIYATNKMLKIGQNLRSILKYSDINESLGEIIEGNKEFVYRSCEMQMTIACKILEHCGFNHVNDCSIMSKSILDSKVLSLKEWVVENESLMNAAFPVKNKMKKWNYINGLAYINGILGTIFGCKIIYKGQPRDGKIYLHHKIYGSLIAAEINDNKPYVISSWKLLDNVAKK